MPDFLVTIRVRMNGYHCPEDASADATYALRESGMDIRSRTVEQCEPTDDQITNYGGDSAAERLEQSAREQRDLKR